VRVGSKDLRSRFLATPVPLIPHRLRRIVTGSAVSIYYYNGIRSWMITADGRVTNV
jgi:hypothetical protein